MYNLKTLPISVSVLFHCSPKGTSKSTCGGQKGARHTDSHEEDLYCLMYVTFYSQKDRWAVCAQNVL